MPQCFVCTALGGGAPAPRWSQHVHAVTLDSTETGRAPGSGSAVAGAWLPSRTTAATAPVLARCRGSLDRMSAQNAPAGKRQPVPRGCSGRPGRQETWGEEATKVAGHGSSRACHSIARLAAACVGSDLSHGQHSAAQHVQHTCQSSPSQRSEVSMGHGKGSPSAWHGQK